MNYETMDWEREAKRVASAFGVQGKCGFVEYRSNTIDVVRSLGRPPLSTWKRLFSPRLAKRPNLIFAGEGLVLSVYYRPKLGTCETAFVLTDNMERPKLDRDMVSVACTHEGAVVTDSLLRDDGKYTELLAQGLFNLGLFTPEVEAALQIAVSEHEKLEWLLDYEERYGL